MAVLRHNGRDTGRASWLTPSLVSAVLNNSYFFTTSCTLPFKHSNRWRGHRMVVESLLRSKAALQCMSSKNLLSSKPMKSWALFLLSKAEWRLQVPSPVAVAAVFLAQPRLETAASSSSNLKRRRRSRRRNDTTASWPRPQPKRHRCSQLQQRRPQQR